MSQLYLSFAFTSASRNKVKPPPQTNPETSVLWYLVLWNYLHGIFSINELCSYKQALHIYLHITATRKNKLLEGHSKLITSWELRINTVLWNNLKYFDLQGIPQGSFYKTKQKQASFLEQKARSGRDAKEAEQDFQMPLLCVSP